MDSKIPIEIVDIEDGGCHIFLCCKLEGGINAELILDTGASKTVFDENYLNPYVSEITENETLESSGISDIKLPSKTAFIKRIRFAELVIENEPVVLMDLSHINDLYSRIDNRKIWGLLGGDFLLKYEARIDYQNKQLIINH